jgi:hypothetical protein
VHSIILIETYIKHTRDKRSYRCMSHWCTVNANLPRYGMPLVGPHASLGTVEHKVNALHKNSRKNILDVAQNLGMP